MCSQRLGNCLATVICRIYYLGLILTFENKIFIYLISFQIYQALLNLNDLKHKTAPLPSISVFNFHGSYCYNLCSLSCISCMLKFVYVLMGDMAYCMNKILIIILKCLRKTVDNAKRYCSNRYHSVHKFELF